MLCSQILPLLSSHYLYVHLRKRGKHGLHRVKVELDQDSLAEKDKALYSKKRKRQRWGHEDHEDATVSHHHISSLETSILLTSKFTTKIQRKTSDVIF